LFKPGILVIFILSTAPIKAFTSPTKGGTVLSSGPTIPSKTSTLSTNSPNSFDEPSSSSFNQLRNMWKSDALSAFPQFSIICLIFSKLISFILAI
jgi:hypothetical protein